jgi:hypothetical protein
MPVALVLQLGDVEAASLTLLLLARGGIRTSGIGARRLLTLGATFLPRLPLSRSGFLTLPTILTRRPVAALSAVAVAALGPLGAFGTRWRRRTRGGGSL